MMRQCPSRSSPLCGVPTGGAPPCPRAPRGGLEDDPHLLWLWPAQPAARPPPGKPAAARQRRGVWEAEQGGAAHQQARRAARPLPLCGWGEPGGWLAHKPSRAGFPSMRKGQAALWVKKAVCGLGTWLSWMMTWWRRVASGSCQLSWMCVQGVVFRLTVLQPEASLYPSQRGSGCLLVIRFCQGGHFSL